MHASELKTSLAALVLSGFVLAAYACGGGISVGNIRERPKLERGESSGVQSLVLEPVKKVIVSDSRSPAWSPDGRRVAFSQRYFGQILVFDIDTELTETVYDSATAPHTVNDTRYNIEDPVFFDDQTILSASSYGGPLSSTDPWTGVLLVDLASKSARSFGSFGARPRVRQSTGEVLLEATDGLRLVDEKATELRQYSNMYEARWAPNGDGFAALEYPQYPGDNPRLVWVKDNGEAVRLQDLAFQPRWAPDGAGLVFIRPNSGLTYFDPHWEYGSLHYVDVETLEVKPIAERARNPDFAPKSGLLFYETPDGLGVSDLEESRIFREHNLLHPKVSPDGNFLAGVLVRGNRATYTGQEAELVIYSITFQ